MKVGYKVWIDNDGKAFGEGPYQVLRQIEQTGSLHKAAIELNMSYRKAWLMIKAIEKRLGFPLLERKVGGVSGGGSSITPEGRQFLKSYEGFRKDVKTVLEETFKKHFSN
ncbi:MAG TPA: LysR family transcriptional regulator, partial [Syntrophorhabdaceae bacterium]|nr:LysR family transcriptional regulator [Syntrophorhabdaceae bacterium]